MENGRLVREISRLIDGLLPDNYMLAVINMETGFLEPALGQAPVEAAPFVRELPDDLEISLTAAMRLGVFGNVSYTSIQAKLIRTRSKFPDIAPSFRARGSQTLYRVGDLRKWMELYVVRVREVRSHSAARANESYKRRMIGQQAPGQLDGLDVLMGKIRKEEEEDVREEEAPYDPEAAF